METSPEFFLLNILSPVVLFLFLIALGVIALNHHFRKNLFRQLLEKEEMKTRHQTEMLRATLESQEAERKRIAMDIHDEIGGLLNTSRIFVSQLGENIGSDENRALFDEINNLYGKLSVNIRRIAHDLRPVVLEKFGLVAAIENLEESLDQAGIQLTIDNPRPFKLPEKSELVVYRILQELISNTLKHAKASEISIGFEEDENRYLFSYADNGIGFPESGLISGLGLVGIQSRLSIFEGSLEYFKPAKGVLIQFTLPKSTLPTHDSNSSGR